MIGPLFGAWMYEKSGFRMTSDFTAMIAFLYALIFVLVLYNTLIPDTNR